MEPAAAYAFMGFRDRNVDAADAIARFKEMRSKPEYKEEPLKGQLTAAYCAIKRRANAVSNKSSQVLEQMMQTARLCENEKWLVKLVDGQGSEEAGYAVTGHAGVAPPSEILEGFLYLGGEAQAADAGTLQGLGITHILNMTDDLDDHSLALQVAWQEQDPGVECSYYNCPALDEKGYNISQHLDQAIEFIDRCGAAGGRVLVHCRQGVNRSGSVVIAYVMRHAGGSECCPGKLDFPGALRWVRQRRPMVLTNGSFAVQLIVHSGMELSEAAANILNEHFFNPFVS